MTYYVLRAAAALVAFPVMLPMLYFRYHTMRYKFDAEGFTCVGASYSATRSC